MAWKQYITEIFLALTTLISANGWMRSRKERKAKEAEALEVAAKQNIENAQIVVGMLQQTIVDPLKKEVIALRNELRQFRRAIEKIPSCPYSASCPVSDELKSHHNCDQL